MTRIDRARLWIWRTGVACGSVAAVFSLFRTALWTFHGNWEYAFQDAVSTAAIAAIYAASWWFMLRPLEKLRREEIRESRALAIANLEKELEIS